VITIEHVETNLTVACQNRCIACNHLVAIQSHDFKSTMAAPAVFARDLANLGRIARVAVWAAIGGEPLLHPDLVEFLRIAKASSAVGKVEIRTNGQALLEAPRAVWALTDRLIVTPYPGKLEPGTLEAIADRCRLLGLELEIHKADFMRLLEPAVSAEKAARKYRACWFRTFCRVLDRGFFYRCCTAPFIPKLVLGLPEGTDGLRIDEATSEADLAAYLEEDATPASCAVCCGMGTESTRPLAWREISDPGAWLEASGMGG
jgi:GTP 3',8-cyclase